jgi:hypothetical protein
LLRIACQIGRIGVCRAQRYAAPVFDQEVVMPQLMIACPVTRRSVPTNKSVRREALATADLGTNVVTPCPYCRGSHTWTIRNAFPAGTPAHLRPRRVTQAQDGD